LIIATDRLAILAADGMFTYGDLAVMAERVAAGLLDVAAPSTRLGQAGISRSARRVPRAAQLRLRRRPARDLAGRRRRRPARGVAPARGARVRRPRLGRVDRGRQRTAGGRARVDRAPTGAQFLRTPDLLAGARKRGQSPFLAASKKGAAPFSAGAHRLYQRDDREPKGVVTTHAQHQAQIEALLTAWEWTRDDNALLVLPLHHVHGIVNVLGSALAPARAARSCRSSSPRPPGAVSPPAR
jgi:hypothetical protein